MAIAALVLLALHTAVISVDAHMPGAKAPPAFELSPIVITDDGAEQPDWVLFEGVEEPEEEEPDIVGGAIFFSIRVIGLGLLLGLSLRGKAR